MANELTIKEFLPTPEQSQMAELHVFGITTIKGQEVKTTGTITEDAKLVGIDRCNWSRWRKSTDFNEYVNKLRKENRQHYAPSIDKAVIKRAISGNSSDARLYYELEGEINNDNKQITPTAIIINVRPIKEVIEVKGE